MQPKGEAKDIEALTKLAEKAIEKLSNMKQPVVRVCGPLTTGGLGYEGNIAMFAKAVNILKERNYSVFDYALWEDEIKEIYARVPHEIIMEVFHKPILQSGYIKVAFFLPGWQDSKGATWERAFIKAHTKIEVEEFPEGWLK